MWAHWACLETGTGTNSSADSGIRRYIIKTWSRTRDEAENTTRGIVYCTVALRNEGPPSSALAISIVCDETATSQVDLAGHSLWPECGVRLSRLHSEPWPSLQFSSPSSGLQERSLARSDRGFCFLQISPLEPGIVVREFSPWSLPGCFGCDRVHDSKSI